MSTTLGHLLTALVITLVVGLVSGDGWASFVVGAVLALSLWVMLFAGSYATPGPNPDAGSFSTRQYAVAAAIALLVGYVMSEVGDGASWWAVGVIVAGLVVPTAAVLSGQSRGADGGA